MRLQLLPGKKRKMKKADFILYGRRKQKMKLVKKAVGLALAAVMAVSLAVIQTPQVVFAADVWGSPTVNAWTEDISGFTLETGGIYKKLQFGKYNGSAVNWYIANVESGSADLLAYELQGIDGSQHKPFGTLAFSTAKRNKTWDNSWGTYTDRTMEDTDQVCPNHYGASEIRTFLADSLSNDFTYDEQDMMNEVEILIPDHRNATSGETDAKTYPAYYTVRDKLYLAKADSTCSDTDNIYIGSGGSVAVPITLSGTHPYGSSVSNFWLAAPYYDADSSAMYVIPGSKTAFAGVNNTYGVCPACSLDLSSALFFSAAPAAVSGNAVSGTLTGGEAFVIRHDGTGTTALADASVKFDAEKITAKAGTSAAATLVAQWNDGSSDYYYERPLAAGETVEVAASDIAAAAGIAAAELSEDCKVWLEYTDSDANFVYAKKGTFESAVDISDATLSADNAPVYTGEAILPDEFGITVNLDGADLSDDAYTLGFYTDVNCTSGSRITEIKEAGVYYVNAVGSEAQGYTGVTTGNIKVKVYKAVLPKPEAVSGTIIFDGTEKTGVRLPAGADPNQYIISGDKATEVGVYTVNAALANPFDYCWTGESGDPEDTEISKPFTIEWKIEPAATVTYKVTFMVDGAKYLVQEVEEGAFAAKPEDPEKTGAAFAGWFASEAATGSTFDFDNTLITADTTLYAGWVTEPAPPQEFKVLEGEGQTSDKSRDESAVFRSEGEFENFVEVQVDQKVVSPENYTVTKGSTIITFKPGYIKTLNVGEHTLRIIFTNGYSVAKWNIVLPDTPPDTGDASDAIPFVILLAAAGAAEVVLLARRRRNIGR